MIAVVGRAVHRPAGERRGGDAPQPLDMRRIRLMYMIGEKNKKASPPRPYDRYVMYRGLTSTAVMIASQLNTSGVYDIK